MECIKLIVVGEVRKTDLKFFRMRMRPRAIQRLQIYLLTCFYIYQTPLFCVMFVFISVLYFRLPLISWEMKVGQRRCKCKILFCLSLTRAQRSMQTTHAQHICQDPNPPSIMCSQFLSQNVNNKWTCIYKNFSFL